jgi:serine protease Do
MKRYIPYMITSLLSIAIALCLFMWIERRSGERTEDMVYAPGLQYAAQKGREATVYIQAFIHPDAIRDTTSQDRKTGSGVVVSPEGHIVTNYHVVSNAESIHVLMSNLDHFKAEVIGTDSAYDLAIIKINQSNLSFLEFGDSDALQLGESVIAIGSPYKLNHTITSGIISALNRNLEVPGNATRNLIQTDVPINSEGQLMGIMSILVTVSGQYEGYSFAMPSNLVKKIANDLRQHGQRRKASIGMSIRRMTREIADYARMAEVTGVVVESLHDGGAADVAGVQSLDIILSADGKIIESTSAFLAILVLYAPGDTMRLVVNRDGTELDIDVIMQEVNESL